MKDYNLKLRNLRVSHTVSWSSHQLEDFVDQLSLDVTTVLFPKVVLLCVCVSVCGCGWGGNWSVVPGCGFCF